ncbi:MAG: RDD family protein [Rubripirellula sp.]|nr:RDD family protein [Rubripirellula sp.]
MKIKCPACQAVLSIPPAAAGKVVKCPCGKQLRAPAATGAPTGAPPPATAGRQTQSSGGRKPPASSSGSTGGIDTTLFDELTDDDLKPLAGGGVVVAPTSGPSSNTAKLLQQHAATAGGAPRSNLSVGPVASRGVRLGAALIDGAVINVMVWPVLLVLIFVVGPMMFDQAALGSAMDAAGTEDEKTQIASEWFGKVILFYLAATPFVFLLPVTLFAWMVTKSGQTPGKKLCKIRIVRADTKQLPGFVKGVLIRSWLAQVLYCVPFVGLVGILMIFGQKRQCLHDVLAGTIVVEA